MPFLTVKIVPPGVHTVATPTLVQTSIIASDKIRFRQGLPEKLGGWSTFVSDGAPGVIRDLWAWADINQTNQYHLSMAGDQGVFIVSGNYPEGGAMTGLAYDQTPQYFITTPVLTGTPSTSCFQTFLGSSQVTIFDPQGNVTPYMSITLEVPVSIGGVVIWPGNYPIISSQSTTQYTIQTNIPTSASLPTAATGGVVPQFAMTQGSPLVTVTFPNHGLVAGNQFAVGVPTLVPTGGTPQVLLSGFYTVLGNPAPTATTFCFNAENLAPSTSSGTYYGNLGGKTQITYWVVKGQQPVGAGWGNATWGQGLAPAATPPQNSAYGQGSPPPPITGSKVTPMHGDEWEQENFGSVLIIHPQDQPLFYWDPTTGVLGAQQLWQGPAVAHGFFIAMPQQMIVCYGASVGATQDPMLVAWCDAGDMTDWTASPSNMAGTFRLSRGSQIVAGIQGPQQAMLWTDVGLWLMSFIGYPDVWGFGEIARGCGLFAKKSIGVLGPAVFWMAKDAFWMYVNGGTQIIDCDVWPTIFKNMKTGYDAEGEAYTNHIRCLVNTGFNEIAWHFPSYASVDGENDMYVKYNIAEKAWDYGWLGATAGVDQNVFGHPLFALNATLPGNYSPPHYQVMQGEMTDDANGAPLQYSFQTGFFSLTEGEDKVFVDYMIPDFKWARWRQPQTVSAQVQMTFFATDFPDDPGEEVATDGPYTVTNRSQAIAPRIRGRYFSMQVAGNDLGSFVRLGGIKLRYAPDGRGGS